MNLQGHTLTHMEYTQSSQVTLNASFEADSSLLFQKLDTLMHSDTLILQAQELNAIFPKCA